MVLERIGVVQTIVNVLLTLGCAIAALRSPAPRVWYVGSLIGPMRGDRVALQASLPERAVIDVRYRGELPPRECRVEVFVTGHWSGDHLTADAIEPTYGKYPGECWFLRCDPNHLDAGRRQAAVAACARESAMFR